MRLSRAVAGQDVVKCRADEVLDANGRIAFCIAAPARRAVQPRFDAAGRTAVVQRVRAAAAVQPVGPGAAKQTIIARARFDQFGGIAAVDRVVARGGDDPFDIGERVALGLAPRAARPSR